MQASELISLIDEHITHYHVIKRKGLSQSEEVIVQASIIALADLKDEIKKRYPENESE